MTHGLEVQGERDAIRPSFLVLVVLVTLVVSLLAAFLGGTALARTVELLAPPSDSGGGGHNMNMNPKAHIEALWRVGSVGMVLATTLGTVVVASQWQRPEGRLQTLASCLLLLFLTGTSAQNLMAGDSLIRVSAQLVLDLALVPLGLLMLIRLWRAPVSARGAIVAKWIACAIVALERIVTM